jgi:hypothetical protein
MGKLDEKVAFATGATIGNGAGIAHDRGESVTC